MGHGVHEIHPTTGNMICITLPSLKVILQVSIFMTGPTIKVMLGDYLRHSYKYYDDDDDVGSEMGLLL